MKKILVPCDFSKPAVSAFRLALDVAQLSKGIVHLLHVIELPILKDSVIAPVLNFEEKLLRDLNTGAEKKISALIAKYSLPAVKVITTIIVGGVSRVLLDYISENSVDLVLMGSRGTGGLKEILIGSNAEKMVRNSPVPVLVLKQYYKGPIKNIVFPNTLETEQQEELVMKVKALQAFFKATLHVVYINTPSNFTPDRVSIKRLETFAKRFLLGNYTLNIFNHTSYEEGILQFRSQIAADLIAMGTHGRTGVSHIINGSLAEDVVNHTDTLVWTYSMKNVPVNQVIISPAR